jgi:4-amino-4-deoxy-L-arabinose transferase-like glycosyltransferase
MLFPKASRWGLFCIVAGAAALYLLGNERIPLWDRDEPRYAECSREMLRGGDWVVPRFLGELRAHKPPLVYWCQATAMQLFGETAAAARLPSTVAVTIVIALLAGFVRRVADVRLAAWSAFVFATSALVIAGAKLCITDGPLLLWICIGQGCLYLLWQKPSVSAALIFWLATGLAGLTKGPVVLLIHAGTLIVLAALDTRGHWREAAAWKRAIGWWRRLHPIIGLLIVCALVLPWIILVHQRAPSFLPLLLSRAGRYASGGAEGHAAPPGYYLLLIWGLLFPWSFFLPAAVGTGLKENKDVPLARFALAAAIGPWFVMELLANKLPFYILPCFPALAVLTAQLIVRRNMARGPAIMGGAMAFIAAIAFAVILPGFSSLAASRTIGRELASLGAGGSVTVAMIDYREPSLAFYQGGGARESSMSAISSPNPPNWAVITTDAWARLSTNVHNNYQIMDHPVPAALYNDGWRTTRLIIVHASVQ